MNARGRAVEFFGAGVLAGLLATALGVAARFAVGAPTLFDLAENAITRTMPPTVFAFLLDRLQFSAKPLLFLGLVAFQILALGLLGIVFAAALNRWPSLARPSHGAGLIVAAALWILLETVALPGLGQGWFGAATLAGPLAVGLTLALVSIVYAVALSAQLREKPATVDGGRRRLVGGLAAGATAMALGAIAVRAREPSPATAAASDESLTLGPTRQSVPYPPRVVTWSVAGLAPAVTPTSEFYTVTKNLFGDPQLKAPEWSLRIDGLVARPLRLRYADVTRLPAVELYQTLECISNNVGGDLISTAWWRGARLADLLDLVGPDPKTVKVVFHAADGYADSLPLERARRPDATLAYLINGQPLPPAHGFPLRLLAPGKYGLKNVKWITHVELVADDFQGYWQERGWTDDGRVHTMSRIDTPADGARVSAGLLDIAGVAFAGDRGITRVQVTLDSGKTWRDAELEPALSPFTWTRWRLPAEARPGRLTISVQATDGTGQVQWQLPQDTVPDGATGTDLHLITVV